MISLFDDFKELLSPFSTLVGILKNGMGAFIDFIIRLPSFFHELIFVIPEPLNSIVLSFIGLIIFIIVLRLVK